MDELNGFFIAIDSLAEIWGTDNLEGAKFKVGDKVKLRKRPELEQAVGKSNWKKFAYKTYTIRAMNNVGENGFEYVITGYPFLVWEYQIREA